MKNLILDYLSARLPANQNFLQYVSEEMNKNLIIYLSAICPDSENKAYVLSGCEQTNINLFVYISKGVVFYNNEIYFVPQHSRDALYNLTTILNITTSVMNEEYGSGESLPAYEIKKMAWQTIGASTIPTGTNPPLLFANLVRRDVSVKDISIGLPKIDKKEAKIVNNGITQTLILQLQLLDTAIGATDKISISTGFQKTGFLGYGKISNLVGQQTKDVCIYQIGTSTIVTLPHTAAPTTTNEAVTLGALCQYIGYTSATPSNNITIYANLTHERL